MKNKQRSQELIGGPPGIWTQIATVKSRAIEPIIKNGPKMLES